ncbi:MAG: hypothetical protein IT437_05550 [Phycisphaerales bacterium]|nr:hypothetical protein [Phycisphaerales bacterium]
MRRAPFVVLALSACGLGALAAVSVRDRGTAVAPVTTEAPVACVPCAAAKANFGHDPFFAETTNDARRWLVVDLPAQDSWSVTDVARVLTLASSTPKDAGLTWENRLVRSWALLAAGTRLSKSNPGLNGCESLLVNAITGALADSDPGVRYAAMFAAMDAGLTDRLPLADDPDGSVAELVGWRKAHQQAG